MKIKFLGAARTVTGSCFVMEAAGRRFAVDCGMHQGNREIDSRNWKTHLYRPKDLDFILVTHAHIDHTGLLPRLVQAGFDGPVYCTPPTRDLMDIMLLDSAHIQEMEAEWRSRKRKRHGDQGVEPLYTGADAEAALKKLKPVEYNKPFEPAPGVSVNYQDAGHILGSSFIEMCITEDGKESKVVFSGDLGRPDQLIVRDPSVITSADHLFVESTYGDRNHKDESHSRDELAEAIAYSHRQGEKVIIPAFAVERTQEVLYSLHLLESEGKLPPDMPVFLDSPMAIRATEVFRNHPGYFDTRSQTLMANGVDPLKLANLRYTPSTGESQSINLHEGPAIVISASGMCNAGRIKHHLRHNLWRPGASVVFVGYQGMGTPGRKIVDGEKKIRIFGEDVAVKAKVFTIGGFSAHAGQSQILDWLGNFQNPAMQVYLVHGEAKAQDVLAGLVRERYNLAVHVPDYLDETILEPGVAPEVVPDVETARPGIDWEFLLGDMEGRVAALRQRMGDIAAKGYLHQTELRDRLLDVNRDLTELMSEL